MNNNRIKEIDALRGIAAILVLFYHYTTRYHEILVHPHGAAFYLPWGQYGVDLFFMISGFVIYYSLELQPNIKNFVISRISRLYPSYWVAITFTFIIVYLNPLPHRTRTFLEYLFNWTMLQHFFKISHVDWVYWTLSYELVFYVFMGFLLVKRQLANVEYWMLFFLVVQGIYFLLEGKSRDVWGTPVETLLLCKYGQLFFAGILFYRVRSSVTLLRIVLLLSCLGSQYLWWGPSRVWFMLLFYGIFYLLNHGFLNLLANRVLLFLGAISYPLYLIHQYAGYVLLRACYQYGFGFTIAFSITTLIVIIAATLIHYGVEMPGRKAVISSLSRDPCR